jgi:hypothetical protein
MSNEITIRNETQISEYAALDANIGNDLDGELLLFNGKHGEFTRGADKTLVPLGTELRFAPTSVQDGYQKWEDGKIVDGRFREWISSQHPILRNDLGDFEERDWPNGKDPWAHTILVAIKDEDGALLKFSTSSKGGENAVRRLMRDWKRERAKNEGFVPVIKLGSDTYLHKVHKSDVIIPTFTIIDWAPWDLGPGKKLTLPPPGWSTPDDPRTQIREELDDAIPF